MMLQPSNHRCRPWMLGTAVLLAAATAPAQTPADTSASPSPRDPGVMVKRVEALVDRLNLSTDQRSQVDDIFKHGNDEIVNAAPDLKNASPDDKAGKYREIMDDLRQQLAGVLTDEQKQSLQQQIQSLRRGDAPAVTPTVPPAPTPSATPTVQPATKPTDPVKSDPQGAGRPGKGNGRGAKYLDRLRENLSQLNLTDSQKTQVDAALDQMQSQFKELRESLRDGKGQKGDAKEKVAAILADARTKVGGILDSDQQEKLRTLMQDGADGKRPQSPTPALSPSPTTAPVAINSVAGVTPTVPNGSGTDGTSPLDVGQAAPDFKLKRSNGDTVQLSSSKHHLLVLVFGSLSAPVLRDHVQALNDLRDKYGSRGVDFLVVYTKEQHPVGGWELQRNKDQNVNIPLAKTAADRNTAAEQLHDSLHLTLSIAADTMDDQTAKAYGVNQTIPAFLIDQNGSIAFHQSWLEPDALGRAVDEALAAEKRN